MLRSLAHHAHRFQCAYLGGLQITDDPSSGSLISAGFGLWSFGRLFLGQRAIIWRTMGGAAYHGNCACFLFVTVLRRAVRMLGIGFSRDAVIMDMDQGCSRLAAHALYLYCRPWECTGLCPHISRIGLVLNQRKVSKLRWRGSEPSAYIPSLISTNRRNTSCSKRPCAHESRRCQLYRGIASYRARRARTHGCAVVRMLERQDGCNHCHVSGCHSAQRPRQLKWRAMLF